MKIILWIFAGILIIILIPVLFFVIRYIILVYFDGSVKKRVTFELVERELRFEDIEELKCPTCFIEPNKMRWYYFRSSNSSWRHLAGTEGFHAKCPKCRKIVDTYITRMN